MGRYMPLKGKELTVLVLTRTVGEFVRIGSKVIVKVLGTDKRTALSWKSTTATCPCESFVSRTGIWWTSAKRWCESWESPGTVR